MIYSPSNLARAAWLSKLSDPTIGFNPTYAAAVSQYANAQPININFTLGTTQNFFEGRVDPQTIETTGVFTFPMMCLYATAGKNTNQQKFQKFSGPVRVITDVHLSGKTYTSAKMLKDFETWADAVEHTLVYIANTSNNQNWGPVVSYTGDSGYERQPIVKGGTNWLQTIRLQLTFTVNMA